MSEIIPRPIIVLGAGIIGLTTAIRVLESPICREHHHPIHIIADHLPSDPLDAKYASTLAGAHHLSFAADDDERQRRWDRTTFRVMCDELDKEGEASGLMRIKQTEYYVDAGKHLKIYEEHPDFRVEQSPLGDHTVSFTSITMTPLTYMQRLLRILDGRVKIHRHHLPSLAQLSHPSSTALIGAVPPLAVVVCAGLGSASLGGVEDPDLFPTRGQLVKIHAPWIKAGCTRQIGRLGGGEGGERTYIIPRADGEVILGGTREGGDWNPYPREETACDILPRTLEIFPELCPPATNGYAPPRTEDEKLAALEGIVIRHLVGFRPSRKGGTRLERGPDLALTGSTNGLKTAVIYNYGHGGAGWQSSWGCAEDAATLLQRSLGH